MLRKEIATLESLTTDPGFPLTLRQNIQIGNARPGGNSAGAIPA